MKEIVRFIFILFLEISSGITLTFLFYFLTDLLGYSNISNGIYYLVILLPPFTFSIVVYLGLKKKEEKTKATTVLLGAIAYLVGGLIYLFTNWQ